MDSKVVVITGASSGIGAALAKQLSSQGNRLVLAARRENLLRQVAEEAGTEALPVVADVTRRGDVEHLRDVAIREFGHVDVWVNNAGSAVTRTVLELSEEDFQSIINVVLKSVLYGMQTIIPHFQERGEGHLINVSSFLGRVPLVTYRSIYNAAKSGVNVLTANLRMDLKAKYPGIHVSLVMPGTVDTDFHRVAKTPMKILEFAPLYDSPQLDENATLKQYIYIGRANSKSLPEQGVQFRIVAQEYDNYHGGRQRIFLDIEPILGYKKVEAYLLQQAGNPEVIDNSSPEAATNLREPSFFRTGPQNTREVWKYPDWVSFQRALRTLRNILER